MISLSDRLLWLMIKVHEWFGVVVSDLGCAICGLRCVVPTWYVCGVRSRIFTSMLEVLVMFNVYGYTYK